MKSAFGVLLGAALAAPAASAAPPVRLAVIEDEPTLAVTRLSEPVERALREASAELLSFETVACRAQGSDFSCLLPPRSAPPPLETGEALVLEDESELAFVLPADAGLAAALRRAAGDPSSYRVPHSARLREGEADAAESSRPDGATTLSLRARLGRPLGLRRRTTLAGWYRVRVGGREAAVLVIGRLFGGVGRLAGAAAREGNAGAWTGVARGGTFGGPGSDTRGRALLRALERAGLRVSAVGSSELENWEALLKERAERPDGVRFLSANLAGKDGSPFPAYELLEASGTRVALVGLTSARGAAAQAALARHGLSLRDPAAALETAARVARVEGRAEAVVVLADLSAEEGSRVAETVGADLIVGHDARGFQLTDPPSAVHAESDRAEFSSPFPTIDLHSPALDLLELSVRAQEGRAEWRVTHRGEVLDDSTPEAEGFPEFPFERFATGFSTSPPLLPSPREVFASTAAFPAYSSRQFWTLAAAMLAERADAEAALLPVSPLTVSAPGEAPEEFVREWLGRRDDAVLLDLPGGRLKALREEALAQAKAEDAGLPPGPRPRFALAGFDGRGRVRGAPLEAGGIYRVASSRALADALGLDAPRRDPPPEASTVGRAVLGELRARAGREPASRYADWITGRPVSEPGLWTIDFRDVSLNLRQTKVVRNSDFDPVPNSRVQGFDELLVGGALKTDAVYARTEYRWTNTVELEYAKSRIRPRNAPETTNLAANRIMLRTLGTRRAGGISWTWLARSFGPSLGAQFDGEFESAPGLRRKQIYSVYPGVELFDGSFIRSLELSGNIRRDLSRDPPATQSGLRARALFSAAVGGATLQGEVWNNYFFLTNQDKPTDLRVEGNANAKLRVPIRKHLWVAPFVDMHWFQLKTKPSWGYSLMTGVSLGFSRLWKPQYERF